MRTQAIVAVVLSVLGLVVCCLLSLPSLITAAIALNRVDNDPRSARTLMLWSWWMLGIGAVLGVLAMIAVTVIPTS